MPAANFYAQVYAVVRHIPRGRVTTYGRIAQMLGRPQAARAVGYALNALRDSNAHDVPWQRVVNRAGTISTASHDFGQNIQATRLRAEGVVVDDDLRVVNFAAVLWDGLNLAEIDAILNAPA